MITVLPEGGLCNRMRVVASAWLLAQACGQPMRVLWHRTPDFNASFGSIFATNRLPFEVLELTAMSKAARAVFRLRQFLAKVSGSYILGDRETEPGKFSMEEAVAAIGRQDVFVRTNSRLCFVPGMYDIFSPAGEAATLIENMAGSVADCVGVHVRRTDNTQALLESSLERFIELMRLELSVRPDVRFYLATDDPTVTAAMKEAFGERVWEYKKRAYSRDDPMAIVDAVVDLFLLGNCRKLIGSYWSSFTDTAAELKGIECVIARNNA